MEEQRLFFTYRGAEPLLLFYIQKKNLCSYIENHKLFPYRRAQTLGEKNRNSHRDFVIEEQSVFFAEDPRVFYIEDQWIFSIEGPKVVS